MGARLPTTLGDENAPQVRRAIHGYDYNDVTQAQLRAAESMKRSAAGLDDYIEKSQKKNNAILAQERESAAQSDVLSYLYDPDKGVIPNLTGGDAIGLAGKTKTWFDTIKQRTMADVKDPDLKLALDSSMANIQDSLYQTVMNHESQQRKIHMGSLAQGQGDTANGAVGAQYKDDKLFAGARVQATNAAATAAKLSGDDINTKKRDAVSGLWTTRIKMAMNSGDPNDTVLAGKFYDDAMKAGELSFKDQIDLSHDIKTALPKAQAQAAFQKDYYGLTQRGVSADQLTTVMASAESGGKQFGGPGSVAGKGEPTTSPAGAIGVMQIMPKTAPEAAKLAGLPWDENRYKTDEGYNRALGEAYMQKQLQTYGDPRLALVAYNYGPGKLNKMIKDYGDPRTGVPPMDEFLSRTPAETQAYVARIMGTLQAARGPVTIDIEAAQAKAAQMPVEAADSYMSLVTSHNEEQTQAYKQHQNAVLDKIQPLLEQSNGNINAVPDDLMAEASRMGVLDKVREYKGFTDEGYKNYLDMLDADSFSAVDFTDPLVRMRLSSSDYNTYLKKQGDMVNDPKNAMMQRRVDDAVSYAFRSKLGAQTKGKNLVADPDNKSTDAKEIALQNKVLRFKGLMQAQIQDEYSRTGKVPSSTEVAKMADSLIVNEVNLPGGGFMGLWDSAKSASDIELDDIPAEVRANIEQSRIRDNLPLTETGVITDYLMILKARGQ